MTRTIRLMIAAKHHCHRGLCPERESKENEYSRCGRCRMARYCSRECQRADWPHHMIDCGDAWNRAIARLKGYVQDNLAIIYVLTRESQYCIIFADFRDDEMPLPKIHAPATLQDLKEHGLTPELRAKMDPAGRYAFVKDVITGIGTVVSLS
jgi:hypothetical protein